MKTTFQIINSELIIQDNECYPLDRAKKLANAGYYLIEVKEKYQKGDWFSQGARYTKSFGHGTIGFIEPQN